MSKLPFDDRGSSTSDEMSYPTDLLRQVAAKILVNATTALEQHDQAWRDAQTYINESGPRPFNFWSSYQYQLDEKINIQQELNNVLTPHAQRLRASYEWQIALATSLFAAIDLAEGTENDNALSFQNDHRFGRYKGFEGFK